MSFDFKHALTPRNKGQDSIDHRYVKNVNKAIDLAGKKTIVLPYGADGYEYSKVRNLSTFYALQLSYPQFARQQDNIGKTVKYWIKNADAFIPAFMAFDGFGRCDVLVPNSLTLDLDEWKPSVRNNPSNGTGDPVVIVHAPNHRGFKGTEFIIDAVEALREEGLNVELLLLEGIQNNQVREALSNKADILVEQVVFAGHGLNALEGMASGIATVSNLEADEIMQPFRRWSYFDECPIVSAAPENLRDVLRILITQPKLRSKLGQSGRKYTEKYFSPEASYFLFSNVLDYVFGRKDTLLDLYHPILGEYPNRSPKIQHPLVNSRIVDE